MTTASHAHPGALAERLPDPVFVLDRGARILFANAAAGRALGTGARAAVGRNLAEFVVNDDGQLHRYLALCAATVDATPGSLRLRNGGAPAEYRCEAGLLDTPSDAPEPSLYMRLTPHARATARFKLLSDRIIELGRQVELRMNAEAILDGQRQVLEQIAHEEPLPDVLDTLTRFIDSNSRAGARSSVLLYDGRENTLHHGAAPRLPQHYCEAIDGIEIGPTVGSCGAAAFLRQPVAAADIATDPNWAPFKELALGAGLAACYSLPITGSGDEVLGTFAIYYDQPRDPHPHDRRVLALLARTAGIAIERSAVTAQVRNLLEREREARADAEEANRSKDEFLAMVSHELRNPLNAILGWAKVLIMQSVDDQTLRKALSAIERNASLQAQLIAEILDYSRITAGKLALEIAPTDVEQLMSTAVESARPTADTKGVTLSLDISGLQSETVAMDAARVQQVISNLLSNAIKFTPRGGSISVSARTGRKHLHISVDDTGCGIDAKFLPHVFERFRQQERTQQAEHEGLGLGLAITRHIVEMHHGRITAHSEGRGRGARFDVRLPRRFAWKHAAQSPADDRACSVAGLKVLAVDDAPDTRALMQTLFESAGALVRTAASAGEALEMLERDAPDIVLCDIGMPGMDGYEFVTRLREREARRRNGHLPVIALTAYARSRDRQRALDAGFDGHMAKPIDPQQLVRVIADTVGARRA